MTSLSSAEPGDSISEEKVVLSPTGNFERYSPADFIDVKSVAPQGADLYPPARVIDLEVVEVSYERAEAVLEWTAVGDDYDIGNGESYQTTILYHDNRLTSLQLLFFFLSVSFILRAVDRPKPQSLLQIIRQC